MGDMYRNVGKMSSLPTFFDHGAVTHTFVTHQYRSCQFRPMEISYPESSEEIAAIIPFGETGQLRGVVESLTTFSGLFPAYAL